MLWVLTFLFIAVNFLLLRASLYRRLDIVSQAVLSLGFSVLLILLISSVLAPLGRFTATWFQGALLVYDAAALLLLLRKNVAHTSLGTLCPYSLLLLLIVAVWQFPPSKIIIGGQDPSVYVASASSLYFYGHPEVNSYAHTALSPAELAELSKFQLDPKKYNWPYNGVYYFNNGSGQFKMDFPRGPSYLLGFCFLLVGQRLGFIANSIFSLLAAFTFFTFASRLLGKRWGFFAAVLLALCPAELWFGKATYSEVPSQFAIFFSVLHLLFYEDENERAHGFLKFFPLLVAVLSAAASFLLRPDQILLAFALMGALSFYYAEKGSRGWVLGAQIILLGLVYGVTLEHQATGPQYQWRMNKGYFFIREAVPILLGLGALSLLFYGEWFRRFFVQCWRRVKPGVFSETAFALYSLAAAAFLVYGLGVRPTLEPFESFGPNAAHNSNQRTMNEHIFMRVGFLAGFPNLILALWGIFSFFKRGAFWKPALVVLVLFAAYGIPLSLSQHNSPMLYWASRRYLPIIVPSLILFGMYQISRLDWFKSSASSFVFKSGLLLCSLGPMIYIDIPQFWHREMNGAYALVTLLNERFDRRETIFISDSRYRHQNFTTFFNAGFDVLQVTDLDRYPDTLKGPLDIAVRRFQNQGKTVVLLTRKPKTSRSFAAVPGEVLESIQAPYERLGEPLTHFPRQRYHKNHKLYLKLLAPL